MLISPPEEVLAARCNQQKIQKVVSTVEGVDEGARANA